MTTDTHHRDHAAFLRACAEEPRNHFPRLVYADWLEEVGEVDQAEYLRLSVELADRESDRNSEEDRDTRRLRHRCQTLAKAGRPMWIGRYHRLFNDAGLRNAIGRKGLIRSLTFRHGLPEVLELNRMPAPEWFPVVSSLLPVREVRVGLHNRRISFSAADVDSVAELFAAVEVADVRLTATGVHLEAQEWLLALARSGAVRCIELNGCWSDDGTLHRFLRHKRVEADFFYHRRPYFAPPPVANDDRSQFQEFLHDVTAGALPPNANPRSDIVLRNTPASQLVLATERRLKAQALRAGIHAVIGTTFAIGMLGCAIADTSQAPRVLCGLGFVGTWIAYWLGERLRRV